MRETGVIAKALGNTPAEQEDSKRYIGQARVELAKLKSRMAMSPGVQSLGRRVVLADGAIIFVRSVMGNDFVQITPPARAKPPTIRARRKRPVYSEPGWRRGPDGPAKNGHRAVWDDANDRMLVYSGWDRPLVVIEPFEATPEIYVYPATGLVARCNQAGAPISGYAATVSVTASVVVVVTDLGGGTEQIETTTTTRTFGANAGVNTNVNPNSGLFFAAGDSVGVVTVTQPTSGAVSSSTNFFPNGIADQFFNELYGVTAGGVLRPYVLADFTQVLVEDAHAAAVGGIARWVHRQSGFPRWYDLDGTAVGIVGEPHNPAAEVFIYRAPEDPDSHDDAYLAYELNPSDVTGGDYRPASLSATNLRDLDYSNELWQYTTADGWQQLADISQAAWDAIVAATLDGESRSLFRQTWGPGADGSSTTGGHTVVSKRDGAGNFVLDVQFGGTTDNVYSDVDSIGELWLYDYRVRVIGEEDDPTDTGP